jgi:hypothetical protein
LAFNGHKTLQSKPGSKRSHCSFILFLTTAQNSALRNRKRINSYFQNSFIVLGKQITFLIKDAQAQGEESHQPGPRTQSIT